MEISEQRFWAKVRKHDGCWEWTAHTDKDGYGKMQFRGAHSRASRVSWQIHHGPIPDGLWVLHRCDNPPCCNPEHLFLGTPRDNAVDMVRKGRDKQTPKTHCPRGHEYTADNTIVYTNKHGWRMRKCRTCDRAKCREGYRKHHAKRVAHNRQYSHPLKTADPKAWRERQRDYMRAHRARKKAATHSPPP